MRNQKVARILATEARATKRLHKLPLRKHGIAGASRDKQPGRRYFFFVETLRSPATSGESPENHRFNLDLIPDDAISTENG